MPEPISDGTIQRDVKAFIVDRFLFGQGGDDLGNDDSFLARSLLDSTAVLEMVAFLEETYAIQVEDQELVPDNLDSLNKIAAFVSRKKG